MRVGLETPTRFAVSASAILHACLVHCVVPADRPLWTDPIHPSLTVHAVLSAYRTHAARAGAVGAHAWAQCNEECGL